MLIEKRVRTHNPTTSRRSAAKAEGQSLRVLAYEKFRQQILDGRLHAGQFVSQRELTELLEMPLGAIREMIPRLEAVRLIHTVPKRGLQVARVDLRLIRNAFQVRALIEREAIQHFAGVASDAELDELAQQHRDILTRAESGNPDPALDNDAETVDWGLHDRMVDAMDNDILSEIYRVNSLHVRLIRLDSQLVRPMRVIPGMVEHLRFIKALQEHDGERAVEMLLSHIDSSRQRILHRATTSASSPDGSASTETH
ncbi:GntR family transcriptional regulator [Hydrogenophaga sp.]|jgi:DNA-binding GntR family transcriptional regulator|uniref:GntR family transcriptional regulator n=1 Tax=Hydrogenophaga sp. TaxID=1904254 RepID=UPI003F6FC254